jgi:hypothetical protein
LTPLIAFHSKKRDGDGSSCSSAGVLVGEEIALG